MKFEGIYTPIVTPYRDDFSIDYERLGDVVEFLIEAGNLNLGETILITGATTGVVKADVDELRVDEIPVKLQLRDHGSVPHGLRRDELFRPRPK